MCWPVTCPTCNRTTWAGCGEHVEQVMRGVPADQRCTCDERQGNSAGPGAGARPRQ